jgi:hypothetical protein
MMYQRYLGLFSSKLDLEDGIGISYNDEYLGIL